MKLLPNLLAAAVLAALSAPAFAETEFDVIGGSEISFEGLLQADYNKFQNDVRNLDAADKDGADSDGDMRRAELVFKGKGPGQWNWVIGYDAKAKKWLDTNVGYKFGNGLQLTVGQFKQPNSMEELGSTKNNDFISKSMTTNLYALSRRVGVGVSAGGNDWTLAGSFFGRELTRNNGEGKGFGLRGTFAPINESGNVLHLGLSYVNYEAVDTADNPFARVRVRPDADLAETRLIDTGTFTDADRISTIGAEAAWVHGPVKLQAEYMTSQVSRDLHDDFRGDSWYVTGVWNVTGESWGYKGGNISTGLPNDPAKGMWQLGLRYDHADLNDGLVYGGKESNWTIGANYYWRSNFKFALNYVKVNSEKGLVPVKDDPSILEFRAQIYW